MATTKSVTVLADNITLAAGAAPTNRYLGVEGLLKGLLKSSLSIETVRV